MTLRHWLAALGLGRINARQGASRTGRLRRRRSAYGHAPACVEPLEDRTLLTAYVVNTTADTIDAADGLVSLREAITAANTNAVSGNAAAGSIDGDVITFALNTQQRLVLDAALSHYEITDDLVIDGSTNPTRVALSGERGTRVFWVRAAAGPGSQRRVEFRNIDVVEGQGFAAPGGAIHVESGSDLTLRNVSVSGRATSFGRPTEGGGIFNAGTLSLIQSSVAGSSATTGGGIYNRGALSLFASQVLKNSASQGGGVFTFGGVVTIAGNSLISLNRALDGGGIFNLGGRVRMTGGGVLHNTAFRDGGGIGARAGAVGYDVRLTGVNLSYNIAGPNDSINPNVGDGGGFHGTGLGTFVVNGGSVSGNIASGEGGGLWNPTGATMTVTGARMIGNIASRGFEDAGTTNAGGGVFNDGGTLTLSNIWIERNQAATYGGRQGRGGAIANGPGSSVWLTSAVVIRNAAGLGGAIYNALPGVFPPASIDIANAQFEVNIARQSGGVIANAGRLSLTRSSMRQNVALGDLEGQGGGGIFNDGGTAEVRATRIIGGVAQGLAGSGGGILNGVNGRLTVIDSTIENSGATRAGGAVADYAGTAADPANTVLLAGVFLRNNLAGAVAGPPANPGDGGAVHGTGAGVITLFRNVITGNRAANDGGAVWTDRGGRLRVDETTVSDNQSGGDGGGLFLRGQAVIKTSLVALGTAGGDGGGIWASDLLDLTNSTVGENRARGSGGGIYVNADATTGEGVLIKNSTVVRNRADFDAAAATTGTGGGIFVAAGEGVTLHNTVVALNLAGADPSPARSDFAGIVGGTSSFNLIGDGTGSTFVVGGNGNQVGTAAAPIDPRLGPLADNGGPTHTYLPAINSPLVDRGRDVEDIPHDQRFRPRPVDLAGVMNAFGSDASDIGAVELQA